MHSQWDCTCAAETRICCVPSQSHDDTLTNKTSTVPLTPPPIQPVRSIQLQRIRQATDKRRIPGAQRRDRRAASPGADAERTEGAADAEGAYTARIYRVDEQNEWVHY